MINYSIIIPHFTKSGTQLLERAIDSIPNRDDIEIIVVDNSIEPISPSLFSHRSDVSIYFSDNTRGAGGARNVGIGKTRGKWLLFMDADDFFSKNAFNSFDLFVDSDNDIIFFKPTSSFSDTLEMADRHLAFCKEIDEYLSTGNEYGLRCRYFNVPWAKMFRANFIKTNNFLFDEVPASNDVIFSLKTGLKAQKIAASNDVVYCVTVTKGSITNHSSLRNLESKFNVSIRKNKILTENGYKKECSVADDVLKSAKYGFFTFLSFFWKALITGNLTVGYNRWLKTILFHKKIKKEYLIEE